MRKSRFREEQIIGILKEHQVGLEQIRLNPGHIRLPRNSAGLPRL